MVMFAEYIKYNDQPIFFSTFFSHKLWRERAFGHEEWGTLQRHLHETTHLCLWSEERYEKTLNVVRYSALITVYYSIASSDHTPPHTHPLHRHYNLDWNGEWGGGLSVMEVICLLTSTLRQHSINPTLFSKQRIAFGKFHTANLRKRWRNSWNNIAEVCPHKLRW